MTIKLGHSAEIRILDHVLDRHIGQVVGYCFNRNQYKLLLIKDMTPVAIWVAPTEIREVV